MMKVIHIVVVLAMFYCGAVSAQTEAVPTEAEAVAIQTEAVPAQTEAVPIRTAYVTDKLQLGLHAAEDTSDAPMKNLVSGTALKILERNRFLCAGANPGWSGRLGQSGLPDRREARGSKDPGA